MRIAGATLLPAYVAGRGGSPTRVLRSVGIEEVELREPQAWMDIDRLAALHEAAARELDDSNLGFRFGLTIPLHAYGLLSYVVLNAPTVLTALRNLVRLSKHLTAAAVDPTIVTDGDVALLRFAHETHHPDTYRQYIESVAALLCSMMKSLVGTDWKLLELGLQHAVGDERRTCESLLDGPVCFGRPVNTIAFSASVLSRPVLTADRTLLPVLEKQVDQVIAGGEGDPVAVSADPVITAVRDEIARCLCDGQPALAVVARKLAMSSRTLQRELHARGARFKTLVSETRHDLALQYLTRPELSITEVAFLVGYSELSVFDRAFRQATGMSPRAWRARGSGRR